MAARELLAPHHAEIRRRADIQAAGPDALNSKFFTRVEDDGIDQPFVNPEQIFVVFSLSQRELAPIPRDLTNPGVCFYGAFETRAEAMEHAAIVQTAHPQHSILIDETHNWICAAATLEHLGSLVHVTSQKQRLLDQHAHTREQARIEFEENVAAHRSGKVASVVDEDEDTAKTANEKPSVREDDKDKGRIHRTCRVHGQTLAVVSFLPDDSAHREFIFRVYAFFDNEADANRYVRNVCGCNVQDYDIDVVKTCCWAFPQSMKGESAQKEIYRSEELNKVMTSLKQAPQEVQRFYDQHEAYKQTEESSRTITLAGEEHMSGETTTEIVEAKADETNGTSTVGEMVV